MNETQQQGYDFAKGACLYLSRLFLIGVVIFAIYGWARNRFSWCVDDSDTSAAHRSGLRVHTDAKTGVQYVSTPNGSVTVRIQPDGKPLTR